LDGGVGRGIDAVESAGAGATGQVQFCADGSLKDGAELDIESEVTGWRNEVAKSDHRCRCGFHEIHLAGAGDGIARVARVGYAAESKRTAAGNAGRGRSAVPVVDAQAGSWVEGVAHGISVEMRLPGPRIDLALVDAP